MDFNNFHTDGSDEAQGYTDSVIRIYDEGFGVGFDDGYLLGKEETQLKLASRLYLKCGFSAEQISELVGLSLKRVHSEIVNTH